MDLKKYKTLDIRNRIGIQPFSLYYLSSIATVIFLCHLCLVPVCGDAKHHQTIIDSWASQFGEELNWLAKNMTKADEIKKQYKENNAVVEDKGQLIRDAVENVGKMFRKKTVAVRCIAKKAEELAEKFSRKYLMDVSGTKEDLKTLREHFKYYSSKYSTINGKSCSNRSETKYLCSTFGVLKDPSASYLDMYLSPDKHFYHINVNTSHASVHVPTNVFDGNNETKNVLIWSEELDEVFVRNYKKDPALSWQYFGSETGVLRHFPAKSWEDRDTSSTVDVYDCRKRPWYIETATCSKDIVILIDRSGSMSGYLGFVAKVTIKSLLDTFSNNDFFNIYTYTKNYVEPLVKCFRNKLVQATPENIKVFNENMKRFAKIIGNYSNDDVIQNATKIAFELLKKYRTERKCNEIPCNQAIMLIADNIQGNFTDQFEEYNRINGTRVPVRIFTYLLGRGKSNVPQMQNIACQNRGRFSHIKTLDEVQEKVFDYVETIAGPLVLQGKKHPPTWTHAFKDVTYRDEENYMLENVKDIENLPPRLMIAVGAPAYIINSTNEIREYTGLLGVASTDVPVEDIDKLTLPYKLGVNAYPFIVSNNGFVLLHPDLRPMQTFKMKEGEEINDPQCKDTNKTECVYLKNNYNSIDLTEVEQIDENDGDYEIPPKFRPTIGPILRKLREMALKHDFVNTTNVSVRLHYDKMRRVSEEKYDYYFAPLNSTPFTLGLAIPSTYGQKLIKVGSEIRNNINKGVNMSDLFVGQNWKVHPDWVYCKYHYLEHKSFDTSEEEWLHFVKLFQNMSMEYPVQYGAETLYNNGDEEQPKCDGEAVEKFTAYYCNKELVELLMFDAKVTNTSYGNWKWGRQEVQDLIKTYNATLRFVATMSGLTRWQFIFGEIEKDGDKEFGDYYTKAIDETWYKSAVLQHKSDNESFVYAVPHDDKDEDKEEGDIKVMASHAIFRMDAGKEAPGCVVGFQFNQQFMYKRFKEITSQTTCENCLQCDNDIYECYVIDNNGYIILSKNSSETGTFFGDNHGRAMQTLVELKIFRPITVFDYQAVCKVNEDEESAKSFANILSTPFQLMKRYIQWIMTETILIMSNINIWVQANTPENSTVTKMPKFILKPCDKKVTLYVMQQFDQQNLSSTDWLYFSRIKLSNLLLVVIVKNGIPKPEITIRAEPEEFKYDFDTLNHTYTFPCHKEKINDLESRRLHDCFTEDPQEYIKIHGWQKECSRSCTLHNMNNISFVVVFIMFIQCL